MCSIYQRANDLASTTVFSKSNIWDIIFIWHSEQQHKSIQLYLTYSVYNSQLEDTLKNTIWVTIPGVEPVTSSCQTRK